jgi:hypothetical protein
LSLLKHEIKLNESSVAALIGEGYSTEHPASDQRLDAAATAAWSYALTEA